MSVLCKLCGLKTLDDVEAASLAGARYVGFVFFKKSTRNLDIQTAQRLALNVPVGITKVALVVNASDTLLDDIISTVSIDMLQLHGTETLKRVSEVRMRYGLPVMKAVGIANVSDVKKAQSYSEVADQLLLDAKPVAGVNLPGGNGLSFDWELLRGQTWSIPWMLAGGLTPENVAAAVKLSGAKQVDVSSGIEMSPGQKDPELMARFIQNASAQIVEE
jgi:phosphoribosylanthranilate isomerase